MRVVGFNFKKLEAERKESKKGKLKIDSNIDIEEIEEQEFSLDKDKKALRFIFNFSINYKPGIATITLNGYLIAVFSKENAKKIQNKWEDKKLPSEVKKLIFNFILKKSNLKALELEDELGLPPHLPMPKLKSGSKQGKSYTG